MSRWQASHARLAAHFGMGATVEVRTPNTLVNPNTGAAVTTLAINGTKAAGSTAVDLDAAAVQGVLRKGSKYTVAGHSTTYETTADVTATSNALASVGTTTALEAEATDDDVVTISQTYGSVTYPAARHRYMARDVDGENIRLGDFYLTVATTDEVSEDAEILFAGESKPHAIIAVEPFEPGSQQASTRIHCRG